MNDSHIQCSNCTALNPVGAQFCRKCNLALGVPIMGSGKLPLTIPPDAASPVSSAVRSDEDQFVRPATPPPTSPKDIWSMGTMTPHHNTDREFILGDDVPRRSTDDEQFLTSSGEADLAPPGQVAFPSSENAGRGPSLSGTGHSSIMTAEPSRRDTLVNTMRGLFNSSSVQAPKKPAGVSPNDTTDDPFDKYKLDGSRSIERRPGVKERKPAAGQSASATAGAPRSRTGSGSELLVSIDADEPFEETIQATVPSPKFKPATPSPAAAPSRGDDVKEEEDFPANETTSTGSWRVDSISGMEYVSNDADGWIDVDPAHPKLRIAAALLDILFITAPLLLIVWIGCRIMGLAEPMEFLISYNGQEALRLIFFCWCFCSFAYFSLFTMLTGATLGKMAMHIKVIDIYNDPPGIAHSILRCSIGYLVSILFFFSGIIYMWFNNQKQAAHDKMVGTLVVIV